MRVMYEFDAKDVAQLIADKYGISVHKVSASCDFEDVIFKLDMSEHETPNENAIVKIENALPHQLVKITSENPPTRIKSDPAMQMRYETLTDDKLAEYLANGLDDKFKARLYKRAEKLKKECASND